MEDSAASSPASETEQSLIEAATRWQQRLDSAPKGVIPAIAKQAIGAMNGLLSETDFLLDDPVYCWGRGYYENSSDDTSPTYRDDSFKIIHYGYSEGANVVPISRVSDRCTKLVLVHTIALVESNSISISGSPKLSGYAHLPFRTDHMLSLSQLESVYDSPGVNVHRPREGVDFLANQFSADRRRGRFTGFTPLNMEKHCDEVIFRIESLIGRRGRGLMLKSDTSYVVDTNRNGALMLREDASLRDRNRPVAFMGIGDFRSFDRQSPAMNYQYFDNERHDGLFMAVALSDTATDAAGLHRQLVYVPLVGNNYHYEPT